MSERGTTRLDTDHCFVGDMVRRETEMIHKLFTSVKNPYFTLLAVKAPLEFLAIPYHTTVKLVLLRFSRHFNP